MICINKPESVFLLLGLIFGVLMLLITPPFQVPDEHSHFFRAIQISQGELIAEVQGKVAGGTIPNNAITTGNELAGYLAFHAENKQSFQKLSQFLNLPPEPDKKQFVHNHGVYSPLPYLPQAYGVRLGKAFNLPWVKTMYIGRFVNLLAWLGCVYFAIKFIPMAKWLVCLVSLSPMMLSQAASLSPDSLTNGLSFLFVAIILRFAMETTLDTVKLSMLLFFIILMALLKLPYLPLVFLLLLIPVNCLGVKKYILSFIIGLLVMGVIISFWSYLNQAVYDSLKAWRPAAGEVATYADKFNFILTHPFQYIWVMLNTTKVVGLALLEGFIGRLGWLDTALPRWLLVVHGLMLIFYAATDTNKEILLTYLQKAIIAIVLLTSIALIYTSIYFSWTPINSPVIEGLQGRHFLPLGMLPFLLIYNTRFSMKPNFFLVCTMIYVPFILITTLVSLIDRYYISIL